MKKTNLFVLMGFITAITAINLVFAYGGNQPSIVGHSAGEVEGTVPSGAIIIWTDSTCPDGYTRVSELDGRFIRGASSYGETGGSDRHRHGGSIGSVGDHRHRYSGTTSSWVSNEDHFRTGDDDGADDPHYHTYSGTTDPAGSHSHSLSIDDANNVPRYMNVVFCKRD
jgi:hypothetical protein